MSWHSFDLVDQKLEVEEVLPSLAAAVVGLQSLVEAVVEALLPSLVAGEVVL